MIVNAIKENSLKSSSIKRGGLEKQSLPSFGSKDKKINTAINHALNKNFIVPKSQKEYLNMLKIIDNSAKEQVGIAHNLARKYVIYKNPNLKIGEITEDHFYLAYLKQLYGFFKDVQAAEKTFENEKHMVIPTLLVQSTSARITAKEYTDTIANYIKKEIKRKTKELEEKSTVNGFVSSIEINEELQKNLSSVLNSALRASGKTNAKQLSINDSFFINTLETYNNKDIKAFLHNISMEVMTKKPYKKDAILPYYDNLSRQLIESIDKNYDTYVTYSKEDDSSLGYFINNLVSAANNSDSYKNCKNINIDNTSITVFNKYANLKTINQEIRQIAKDKTKHHIVLLESFDDIMYNSNIGIREDGAPMLSELEVQALFKNKPENIHLIFLDNRDQYFTVISDGAFEKELKDFQSTQIPIMDSAAAKEQLLETKASIEKEIEMNLDESAIDFACDVCAAQKGSKYDNALRLLKNAALYYNNDEIMLTKEILSTYWQNIKKEDLASKDGSYEFIFDTKMTTDDIIGSKMVKDQAKNVVYEIQNYPKTKGYVLYNSEGFGGGRFNCAKAIAGEAKIPMVTINAADFAIRDLDTINSDPMEAIDIKISKLINMVKSQAQANPNKTAMLFISNFDRFASDPLYGISSLYEQQAFKKLVVEMKKAQADKSYNIVVMGSSDLPQAINENIQRPGLFMDEIIIYPPQTKQNVAEVAIHHANKNGYIFDGGNNKNQTTKHLATILKGSTFIEITNIIDKANIISNKQGKESITIEDINEAFLNTLFGPTNEIVANDKQKEVIIRHEGGHALNMQFMYNLFKEQGDSIRIPDSVNNIALDPRGDFLGCIFHDSSDENMTETNLETIFSDIVCSFGGNSVEEHFYNMAGSFGISQDRRNANYYAKLAILHMGLGKNTGHYIPDIDPVSGSPVFMDEMDASEYAHDIKIMLKNAKCLSDKIVKCYEDFLTEFSKKNIKNFATGKCIITGPEFARQLKEWERRQPAEKKKEIYALKKEALKIVEFTRESERYKGLKKYNPKYRTH